MDGNLEEGQFVASVMVLASPEMEMMGGMSVETSEEGDPIDLACAEVVEMGCGKCAYGFVGVRDCATAAKINKKVYLVVGAELDAHENGLCESVKQGTIVGEVMGGKFVASAIQLSSAQ